MEEEYKNKINSMGVPLTTAQWLYINEYIKQVEHYYKDKLAQKDTYRRQEIESLKRQYEFLFENREK